MMCFGTSKKQTVFRFGISGATTTLSLYFKLIPAAKPVTNHLYSLFLRCYFHPAIYYNTNIILFDVVFLINSSNQHQEIKISENILFSCCKLRIKAVS